MDFANDSCYTGPYRATQLWNTVVYAFQVSMPTGRHRHLLRTYSDCFVASDAVTWLYRYLQRHPAFDFHVTRSQATKLLQKFHRTGLFEDVRGTKYNDVDFTDSSGRFFRFYNKLVAEDNLCLNTRELEELEAKLPMPDYDGNVVCPADNEIDLSLVSCGDCNAESRTNRQDDKVYMSANISAAPSERFIQNDAVLKSNEENCRRRPNELPTVYSGGEDDFRVAGCVQTDVNRRWTICNPSNEECVSANKRWTDTGTNGYLPNSQNDDVNVTSTSQWKHRFDKAMLGRTVLTAKNGVSQSLNGINDRMITNRPWNRKQAWKAVDRDQIPNDSCPQLTVAEQNQIYGSNFHRSFGEVVTNFDFNWTLRPSDTRNVVHNMTFIGKNGIVSNVGKKDQFPAWLLNALKFLAYWSKSSNTGALDDGGCVGDVFQVILGYFFRNNSPLFSRHLSDTLIAFVGSILPAGGTSDLDNAPPCDGFDSLISTTYMNETNVDSGITEHIAYTETTFGLLSNTPDTYSVRRINDTIRAGQSYFDPMERAMSVANVHTFHEPEAAAAGRAAEGYCAKKRLCRSSSSVDSMHDRRRHRPVTGVVSTPAKRRYCENDRNRRCCFHDERDFLSCCEKRPGLPECRCCSRCRQQRTSICRRHRDSCDVIGIMECHVADFDGSWRRQCSRDCHRRTAVGVRCCSCERCCTNNDSYCNGNGFRYRDDCRRCHRLNSSRYGLLERCHHFNETTCLSPLRGSWDYDNIKRSDCHPSPQRFKEPVASGCSWRETESPACCHVNCSLYCYTRDVVPEDETEHERREVEPFVRGLAPVLSSTNRQQFEQSTYSKSRLSYRLAVKRNVLGKIPSVSPRPRTDNTIMEAGNDVESRAVDVLQHCCLMLPPSRRRKLQILLRFLNKISTNNDVVLDKKLANRQLLVDVFTEYIIDIKRRDDQQKLVANGIVGFMLDNHSDVTRVPQQLSRDVARELTALRHAKIEQVASKAKNRLSRDGLKLSSAQCQRLSVRRLSLKPTMQRFTGLRL